MLDVISEFVSHPAVVVVFVLSTLLQVVVTVLSSRAEFPRNSAALLSSVMCTAAAAAGPDTFRVYLTVAIPAIFVVVTVAVMRVVLYSTSETNREWHDGPRHGTPLGGVWLDNRVPFAARRSASVDAPRHQSGSKAIRCDR